MEAAEEAAAAAAAEEERAFVVVASAVDVVAAAGAVVIAGVCEGWVVVGWDWDWDWEVAAVDDDGAADVPGAGLPFGRGAVVAAAADMVGDCRRWREEEIWSVGCEGCYMRQR